MAEYTSRTFEERKRIQDMWKNGSTAKEIASAVNAPLRSIYVELKRGQDGTRLPNQRMRYDADLAQLRIQQAFERRGRRAGKAKTGKEQTEHEQL